MNKPSYLTSLAENNTLIQSFRVWESGPIDTYREMFYHVFLWTLFSSIFIHGFAALIAVCCLRKHKLGRWYAVLLAMTGVLGPLMWGSITSAVIAWTYDNSSKTMPSFYAMLAGVTQTIVCVIVSFSRIYATL